MKTIRIILPGTFRYISMAADAAEMFIEQLSNCPASTFYTQGFEKAIQSNIIKLPPQHRKTVEEIEPNRKMVPGSIISLPNISYEVDFKSIGSSQFIKRYE